MSVWTQSNCVITSKGDEALTQIVAKGGTMIFDSVWTCGTRVASSALYDLTELPSKNQRMTVTKVSQVSSGYSISVQVTNEGLTTPYSIEMVGVYMKLNGFNEGNSFLYMVLLSDDGTSDKMTNLSKSTYKYDIYLYHTSKANLQISLTPTDYVATDTYEAGISELKSDMFSLVYRINRNEGLDNDNCIRFYTENHDTHPFVLPSLNPVTKYPVVIIPNYIGYLTSDGDLSAYGVYIDDVGPFNLIPYDEVTYSEHYFDDVDLICVAKDDENIKVTNYFDDTSYLTSFPSTYTSFNNLPIQEGIYKLTGTASNSPSTLTSDKVWTCIVVRSVNTYIMLAVNDYDNSIYRRSLSASATVWSKASSWVSIGGGGGIQTATATFITNSNTTDASARYLRITRGSTVNALKSGDVIMCELTSLSKLTDSTVIYVRYLDGVSYSSYKYIYKPDGYKLACCQLPKYFLLEYDGTDFHILTPLNITTTLSSSDPESTDGKYGDVWYTY